MVGVGYITTAVLGIHNLPYRLREWLNESLRSHRKQTGDDGTPILS
jgi:hypothetical protein